MEILPTVKMHSVELRLAFSAELFWVRKSGCEKCDGKMHTGSLNALKISSMYEFVTMG